MTMAGSPEDSREASYTDPSNYLDDDAVARKILSAVAETRLELTPSGNVTFPTTHQQDNALEDRSLTINSCHDGDSYHKDSTVKSSSTIYMLSSPTKGHRQVETDDMKNPKENDDGDGTMSPKLSPRRTQRRDMSDLEYCEDLVVATAVYDNMTIDSSDDGYLPTCVEYDPDSKPASMYRNKFYRRMACASCITIGVIIGVIVFAVNSTIGGGDDHNKMGWMRDEVEAVIGTTMENLDVPYRKALDWMMQDDPLRDEFDAENSGDWKFYQRYFLTYFYFATTVSSNTEWAFCAPPKVNDDTLCHFEYYINGGFASPPIEGNRWLSNSHTCTWAGVVCDTNQQIESLRTDSFKLSGNFPDGIQHLSTLNAIYFIDSNLRGPLPIDIRRRLPHLKSLNLASNQFTGSLPSQWFDDLSNSTSPLIELDLNSNLLNGTLPSKLVVHNKLQLLSLYENQFAGTIPEELMGMTSLERLALSNNPLTGTIPSTIGQLTNLFILELIGNNLNGTIPTEIGLLNASMYDMRIGSNKLTGEIPKELYELKYLAGLDISHNELNGTLEMISNSFPKLMNLYINDNQLSGSIPNQMESMTKLDEFIFNGNDFTGTIPDGLCLFASERCCQVTCCTVDGNDCPITATNGTNIVVP